jgi:hypothetical protein
MHFNRTNKHVYICNKRKNQGRPIISVRSYLKDLERSKKTKVESCSRKILYSTFDRFRLNNTHYSASDNDRLNSFVIEECFRKYCIIHQTFGSFLLTPRLAADCTECNLITKKTSLCFSIVAKILAERSLPVWGVFDFLLFFL